MREIMHILHGVRGKIFPGRWPRRGWWHTVPSRGGGFSSVYFVCWPFLPTHFGRKPSEMEKTDRKRNRNIKKNFFFKYFPVFGFSQKVLRFSYITIACCHHPSGATWYHSGLRVVLAATTSFQGHVLPLRSPCCTCCCLILLRSPDTGWALKKFEEYGLT